MIRQLSYLPCFTRSLFSLARFTKKMPRVQRGSKPAIETETLSQTEHAGRPPAAFRSCGTAMLAASRPPFAGDPQQQVPDREIAGINLSHLAQLAPHGDLYGHAVSVTSVISHTGKRRVLSKEQLRTLAGCPANFAEARQGPDFFT